MVSSSEAYSEATGDQLRLLKASSLGSSVTVVLLIEAEDAEKETSL